MIDYSIWVALKAPPGRVPMSNENEIVLRVRAMKALDQNQEIVAVKIFDIDDDTKLGIRIDRKEDIFSNNSVYIVSKFKYRNDNCGNWYNYTNNRTHTIIGITKKGGFIPLK